MGMLEILIADPLDKEIEKDLGKFGKIVKIYGDAKQKRLLKHVAEADIICIRTATHMDKDLMERASKLKYILTFTTGTDHIDTEYAKMKGITVIADREGGVKDSVAEHAVGMMIDLARNISYSHEKMNSNEWTKDECMGTELKGKTLGIIGCGRVGTSVARIAKLGLCMKVIGYDPYLGKHDLIQLVSLKELLTRSHIITLHIPLTDETEHMIGKNEFDLMARGKKPYVINTARGDIIDMNKLYTALKRGKISGAALDVYPKEPPFNDREFRKIKQLSGSGKVVLTPHIAGSTVEGKRKTGKNVISQFIKKKSKTA